MMGSRNNGMSTDQSAQSVRRAAMYVRMSTDHQKYSTENQADTIREYAANRRSFKLKIRHVVNEPDMWVRADGVFDAIVDPAHFYTAQGIIRERSRRLSDDEMLSKLRHLHEKQGWLSGIVIDEADDMPSSTAYGHRFGSLLRAYELVGFTPDRDYSYIEINRQLRQTYAGIVEDAIRQIRELGGEVHREVGSDLLFVNGEIKVSVIICRCQQTAAGSYRWQVQLDTSLRPDITVAIRMDAANAQPLDYYLLPALDIEDPKVRLKENNGLALDAYRFDDLQPFFFLTERVSLREAA